MVHSKNTSSACSECGLTPRSSGAPTAGHQARAGGTRYIFTGPGLASCRWRPLSSNVRPHTPPSATLSMTVLEFLQAGDSSIAIATGAVAVLYWLSRVRKDAIAAQYRQLADDWTNEGAVDGSVPGPFIRLYLRLEHGDISGWLHTHQDDKKYSVNVTPAWPRARISVSVLSKGLPVQVIEARVGLYGNNNRLRWKVAKPNDDPNIPLATELWPVPMSARTPKSAAGTATQ
jgi:hypothetical protein